ncbi:MAG: hypothetical protein JWO81_2002 [Alphaproteobacteria bacterium]|nr:hypothetical protein [Alphaproteobacteria bacterium]
MIKTIFLGLLASGITASAPPTATAPAPPQQRPNCSAPEYRQLDFWAGEWKVFDTAKGYRVGTSRIERIEGLCAIRESYDAPGAPGGPYSGTSYSGYDRKDGKWHQMYVDGDGSVSWYSGGLEGADMVLDAPARGGALQRMTYRPHADGSVQQIGLVSADGGKTWAPGYDLTYRKN